MLLSSNRYKIPSTEAHLPLYEFRAERHKRARPRVLGMQRRYYALLKQSTYPTRRRLRHIRARIVLRRLRSRSSGTSKIASALLASTYYTTTLMTFKVIQARVSVPLSDRYAMLLTINPPLVGLEARRLLLYTLPSKRICLI